MQSPGSSATSRGRPRRHVPGPLRTQRVRRGPGQAPDRPRPRQRGARVRPDRSPRHRRTTVHARSTGDSEGFHIGRLAVADSDAEPVVVDWRAPVAEPFYRATGREPMGLARRRHFAVEGRTAARHRGRAVRRGPPRRRPRRGPRPSRRESSESAWLQHADRLARTRSHRAPSATSSRPSRASRTRSSGRRSPACSSSRAAPAPARPSWRCTGRPTCSTPTASRWKTRACS